jgi:hypothetical protein
LNLWCLTRVLFSLHTGPRVQPASGLPCALCFLEGRADAKLGHFVLRERTRMCGVVIASEAKIPWGVDSDQF